MKKKRGWEVGGGGGGAQSLDDRGEVYFRMSPVQEGRDLVSTKTGQDAVVKTGQDRTQCP